MNFSAVLEGASKAAAGVGVILGMSYISGLFKVIGFYGEFHVDWLFEMMDVQAFISAGLPITMLSTVVFSTHFFGLNRLREFKSRGWILLAVVVLTTLGAFLLSNKVAPDVNSHSMAGVLVGFAGAALAAWICHCHFYPSRLGLDVYHLLLALALMLAVGPKLIGQGRAYDIQGAKGETTEVIDSKNHVVGVLVGVVGGKFLILDCYVDGQLSFHEITAALRLRRSSGHCKTGF